MYIQWFFSLEISEISEQSFQSCAYQTNFFTSYELQHDKTNKMICAPTEDSDQPGHPASLIRVFAVRMKKEWVLSYTQSAQQRLWSESFLGARVILLYPPQNGGVYCFHHVRDSVIPKFRQHLMILLYNCDSFCPILFKFTTHHNHQTMHVWQKNQGWRVSITRVMPFVILTIRCLYYDG